MESAIPLSLQCPRTRAARAAESYTPPYPAWVSRADPGVGRVVMGYFGVQWQGAESARRGAAAFERVMQHLDAAHGPAHVDRAHCIDAAGYDNRVAIAYWNALEGFDRWRLSSAVDEWWSSPDRARDGVGYFRELATPRTAHFETLFSTPDQLDGIGVALGGRSEHPIREHGYWGSMRDRLALSQTDAMDAAGTVAAPMRNGHGRVHLAGQENLALIRSGQEWTATRDRERELYMGEMEPALRAGMDFLRDEGSGIGCYSNRYMHHIDDAGRPLEKTFGLSHWRSLAHLERWSESHPTHTAIFGTFMKIVATLEFKLDLRLYHEVSVLKADEQTYEYIQCHAATGLLRDARIP